jgi:hypothetical protein
VRTLKLRGSSRNMWRTWNSATSLPKATSGIARSRACARIVESRPDALRSSPRTTTSVLHAAQVKQLLALIQMMVLGVSDGIADRGRSVRLPDTPRAVLLACHEWRRTSSFSPTERARRALVRKAL